MQTRLAHTAEDRHVFTFDIDASRVTAQAQQLQNQSATEIQRMMEMQVPSSLAYLEEELRPAIYQFGTAVAEELPDFINDTNIRRNWSAVVWGVSSLFFLASFKCSRLLNRG